MEGQTGTQQEEQSAEVFKRFLYIGMIDVLLSVGLLVCGGIGVSYGDGGYFGPPYFTGSFVGGVMFLIKGAFFINLYRQGTAEHRDNLSLSSLLTCSMGVIMFCFFACLVSIILTAVSGVFSSCDRDWFPENDIACDSNHGKYHGVATAIVVLIVILGVVNIYTVFFICSNQARFGIRTQHPFGNWNIVTNRRQLQINHRLMMQNQMMMQQMAAAQGQNMGTGQNFEGNQMGPTAGNQMGPTPGYSTGPVYPMGTNAGFAMGGNAGYPIGQAVPPSQLQPYPQSYPADGKVDLSSNEPQPTAPPPSYESVTQY